MPFGMYGSIDYNWAVMNMHTAHNCASLGCFIPDSLVFFMTLIAVQSVRLPSWAMTAPSLDAPHDAHHEFLSCSL